MSVHAMPIIINCIRYKNYVIPIHADNIYSFHLLRMAGIENIDVKYKVGRNGAYKSKGIRNKDKIIFDLTKNVNKIVPKTTSYIIIPSKKPINEQLNNQSLELTIPYVYENTKYIIKVITKPFDIYPYIHISQSIKYDRLFFSVLDRKNETVPYIGNIYINGKYIPYSKPLEQFLRTLDAYSYDTSESIVSILNKCLFLEYDIIDNKLVEIIDSEYYLNIVSTSFTSERKYDAFIPVYDEVLLKNYERFAKLIK